MLKNLKTDLESSFPGGFNDINISSLGLSPFKAKKKIRAVSATLWLRNASRELFSEFLNGNCSAQNCPRELKSVPLEPPGNENSEYVLKLF
jgi:hypothetical protein